MFSQKLNQISKLLEEELNNDSNKSYDFKIDKIEYNNYDALILTNESIDKVITFVDSEDGFIDITMFSNNNLDPNDYIDGFGIPVDDVKNILTYNVKDFIEDMIIEIDNKNSNDIDL